MQEQRYTLANGDTLKANSQRITYFDGDDSVLWGLEVANVRAVTRMDKRLRIEATDGRRFDVHTGSVLDAVSIERTLRPPAVMSASTPTATTGMDMNIMLALIAAVLVVVGSMGPWAGVGPWTVSGLSGDGWLSLIGGLAAGAVVYRHAQNEGSLVGAQIAFGACLVLSIYHASNLGGAVAWGLLLMAGGSVAGLFFVWQRKSMLPR